MGKIRWHQRMLRQFKHGVASLLVCAVVVLPLLFPAIVWGKNEYAKSSRKATPLPTMIVRPIDKQASPPQLFKQPLISVTFDDGWGTVYTQAMPLLQKYGIHTTQYVLSGTENDPHYLSWAQIAQIQKAGHEIACHTIDHRDLVSLDEKDLMHELTGCKQTLQQRYGPIDDFASPYSSVNDAVIQAIKPVYSSHRNTFGDISNGITDADVNVPWSFDRYSITGVAIQENTTVDQLKEAVNYTIAHNGWLVLTYHQIDDAGEKFGLNDANLEKQLQYLSSVPVRIVTVHQALSGQPGYK